jgi:general stress protein YciG
MASSNKQPSGRSMSVREAGKRGGKATAASHDHAFYERIGSEGGSKSGGNFRNDLLRASLAGRKGARVRREST